MNKYAEALINDDQVVIAFAVKVFANRDKAMRWLHYENRRLEGRTPISLLATIAGRETVREMLIQIDEGIFV